jgi:HEAT repeat protein
MLVHNSVTPYRLTIGPSGLLLAACLVLTATAAVRPHPAQGSDRLNPIQREIERQRQRLNSAEVEERRDALMRLGNLKRPEASHTAAAALSDASAVVRVTAAHAIVSLPAREAASLLTAMLEDKDEFVRREVADVLGELHERSAVTMLIDTMIGDKKPSVRGAAAIALGKIGDETAVTALSQVLTGSVSKKKKKPSIEDEFVMRSAARSLGQIRSRAGIAALITALENSANSTDTRREAANSLGLIGDAAALPALQAAHSSADDPYLADAVYVAMRKINRTKN